MAKLTYLVKQTRLRLTIMLGVMLFVTSMNIYAARFGNMHVLSQKGEPLRAKIEILDVPADEQGWLTLRSAPQYAYDNAALRFTNAAKELRAMVERDKDGKMIAWLTTSTPVNEEFIDLLLTLNWSTGRMTEAFTLLVPHHAVAQAHEQIAAPIVFEPDTSKNQVTVTPNINNNFQSSKSQSDASSIAAIEINPELNGPSSAAEVHSNATEAKVNGEPLQILPKSEKQRTQIKEAAIPAMPQNKPPVEKMISHRQKQNYKVKHGDTLSKIAEQFRQDEPESVTLDQLLVAMYQDNPQAFMGKNMNRLKAGAILKFPVVEEANKINMAQASKQVQLQAGEFERYRASLAEAATLSKASSNMRTSSGQISAAVKENLTKQPAGKLKLSRGNTVAQQREEQKIAQQRAVNDAKEQVDQLEKHVADLQKLAAQSSTQSAQVTPAQNGVPVAIAKPSPFTEIDKALQKVQRFFSRNPAVSLGILLSFLVSGALMLRRRARRKTLFSSRVQQHEVPPTAQKMLTSLNLDLESSVHPQKDLVSLDQRIQEPDQMNTRLELAQAYWDLGDQKGARQLLEEVIAQGSAAQRKQAQTLLSEFQ